MRAARRCAVLSLLLLGCTTRNPAYRIAPEVDAMIEEPMDALARLDSVASPPRPDAAGPAPEPPPDATAPDAAIAASDAAAAVPDAAPDLAPDRQPSGVALLVVGDTQLSRSDVQLRTSLTRLGFTVQAVEGDQTAAGDATGKVVVIISGSAWSDEVAGRFRDVPVPVVVFDEAVFYPMRMTGPTMGTDFGEILDVRRLEVIETQHPLAAGFSGQVTVAESNIRLSWGVPGPTATVAATVIGQPNRFTIFGYEKGVPMVGLVAPERRVGSFVRYPDDSLFTPAGLQLFEASVLWAAHYL
jgi:hypothetical protein